MFVVGFDPGGTSGIAILYADGGSVRISAADAESVKCAIQWCLEQTRENCVAGVGVDAFLHWSVRKSGWRPVDRRLRQQYRPLQNSILCSNSASGSMAIQGMAFAIKSHQIWPEAVMNEVHPKVVFCTVGQGLYERGSSIQAEKQRAKFWKDNEIQFEGDLKSEHQFDAALGSLITYRGIEKKYVDLIEKDADLLFPVCNVKYFWPCSVVQPETA